MLAPTTISLRVAREKRRKDGEETQRAFQLVTLMRSATLLQTRNASRLFRPLEFAIPTCTTSKLRRVGIHISASVRRPLNSWEKKAKAARSCQGRITLSIMPPRWILGGTVHEVV